MLSSAILLFMWCHLSETATSRYARCAVECYTKCMNSGTPNAAYCSCSPSTAYRTCNSIKDRLVEAETIDDVLPVKTEYLDAHRIHIVMTANPNAFIYIFEFSTVSTSPDEWIFAEASVIPEVTFTIPDPCRDYQFRVLIVLRSTNPFHQLATLRPRAIQVTLPEFVVDAEQIRMEQPVYNSANRTVTIYVKWKNPLGYKDLDIYGYEGAAIYPIQCLSPEDELPTPTVETLAGGGRLMVSLPVEMLEGKCRLWVEVRMLPRCVRLEPFSVQQSLELDCEKLSTLDICKHEVSPQCTDVIDVWGSNGNATLMWAHPVHFGDPLYYHVRYGVAQMQGIPPFVSWTIASRREVKTSGKTTSMSIPVDEDTDYGIQICAVYNEQRKKPKFGLVRVTPFICTSCRTMPFESFGRCGECSKIEGPLLFERRCHPKGGTGCTSASWKPNETDTASASLLQVGAAEDLISLSSNPFDIRRPHRENISIIESAAPFSPNNSLMLQGKTSKVTATSAMPTTVPLTTTTQSYSSSGSSYERTRTEIPISKTYAPSTERNHFEATTLLTPPKTTVRVILSKLAKPSSYYSATASNDATQTTLLPMTLTVMSTSILPTWATTSVLEESSAHQKGENEDPYRTSTSKYGGIDRNTQVTSSMMSTTSVTQTYATSSHTVDGLAMVKKQSNEREYCALLNGVICRFGCASQEKCECPENSYVGALNGACVEKAMKTMSSICLAKHDVNATWDSRLRALHIYSQEVFNEMKENESLDKVYVEFGQLKESRMAIGKPPQNVHLNGYVFDTSNGQRNRMVIRKDKILRHGVFLNSPLLFYVNQSVDPVANIYGLRICSFNSAIVKYPFQTDWDAEERSSSAGKRNSNAIQVVQLSPIHFVAGLLQPATIHDNRHLSRLFFIIAPLIVIVLLIILISALLYLNCTRIKRFHSRRKTLYFQPYVGNAGASSIGPYISTSTDSSPHALFITKPPY